MKLEKSVEVMLSNLEPNWKDNPDMAETPRRVARMYEHFFRNNQDISKHIKVFPTTNSQLVLVKNIEAFGLCPHHLLPIIYQVHIGYIPNKKAIGLSKFSRIVTDVASYPKIQENLTTELTDVLQEALAPLGVMVLVDGLHMCMRTRGIEQDSNTITSDCRGEFTRDFRARDELLNLLRKDK
jgi:GTP cyclohydrolase IA